MISFWRIFFLEIVGFVRSKTLTLLLVASVAWVFALPYLVHGDGTAEGAREIDLRYALGGVFVIVAISLLASATGSLARERAAKRLQLTLVRPVHYASIVLAKGLAHLQLGAVVLALSGVLVAARHDGSRTCSHVFRPVLPSPREEAKEMYASFMADPDTPTAAKRAKKAIVLRLLENKALDHYQTIPPTNEVVSWCFQVPAKSEGEPSVRLRFTNQFDSRETIRGVFAWGDYAGSVSNITQAVLTVPLQPCEHALAQGSGQLVFLNSGNNTLMLRPRKDLALLLPADAFVWNLLRSYLVLVAILAVLIAFGLFLSASLGRPVALFVAMVTVVVSEMSPSVVEQYADELDAGWADRIGLLLTRTTAEVTSPVSALNPLEKLSLDECVEWPLVCRALVTDVVFIPLLLAVLSGVVLPRKHDD